MTATLVLGLLVSFSSLHNFRDGIGRYELEYFELATRKTIADQIEPLKLLTDIETFAEEKDFINGIRFYVIVAQPDASEPVYFYHFYTPKKILIEGWHTESCVKER